MPVSMLKLALAWWWFFLLLLSYYILKPIRDGIGSILSEELDKWYLATFIFIVIAMAGYARLVRVFSTRWLVFSVYQFFAISLLFFVWKVGNQDLMPRWLAGGFFVWVSVFNLCSVALFWSVMADIYSKEEAQNWFGVLAGAGSVGALAGSGITIHGTNALGPQGLLLGCFLGIEGTFLTAWVLLAMQRKGEARLASSTDKPTPNLWQGMLRILRSPFLLAICLYVVLGKFSATFLYNNLQSSMLAEIESLTRRTELFAQMNLIVQIGSMLFQYVLVSWLYRILGVKRVLAIPCLVMIALFGSLYFDSSLSILMVAQVVQQIIGYGVMTPSQNLLFTVVPRQDKYVSKGFVDTIVFRFSDVLASTACTLLRETHGPLGILSACLLPLLFVWLALSQRLGREFNEANIPPHR